MRLGLSIALGAADIFDSATIALLEADPTCAAVITSTNVITSIAATEGADTIAAVMVGFPGEITIDNLWDPALGVTIATGVSHWVSQAGQASDLVQATGAAQPTIEASAKNGRSALVCDGTDDMLRLAFTRAAPRTTFIVSRMTENSGALFDGKTVNRNRFYRASATTLSMGNGGGGGGFGITATDWDNYHCNVFNHTAAGTGSSFRSDVFAKYTFDAGATTIDGVTVGNLGQGADDFGGCKILYIVDVAGDLSDGDVAKVLVYLQATFAI